MSQNTIAPRSIELARLLNVQKQWWLPDATLQAYVQVLAARIPRLEQLSDERICLIFEHYHLDHAQVEPLLDDGHPGHADAWAGVQQIARRTILRKLPSIDARYDALGDLEDLVQEAIKDLWSGLPGFQYHSRFHTWLYTLASNCWIRHHRTYQAHKRGAGQRPHSLDQLIDAGSYAQAFRELPPDELVLDQTLHELIDRVLSAQPDQRLRKVFYLRVHEEHTLHAIGARLSLSTARVHALLQQTSTVLSLDPAIREWFDLEASGWAE